MNYYSLEKYYKKSESKSKPAVSKSIEALVSPKNEFKKHVITEPDLTFEPQINENITFDTTIYKNMFKRLHNLSPDLTQAFEVVFSYQFGLNNIMLEVVKTYERLISNVLDSNKSINIGPPKKQKMTPAPSHQQPKAGKSPLEIEINSIVHDIEKSRQEICALISDIIPKKQIATSKTPKPRVSDFSTETRKTPVKRSKSSLRIDRESNQFQSRSRKSSSFMRTTSRQDLQLLPTKQDFKENIHTNNFISINNLLRCSSPLKENKPNSPISLQSLTLPDFPLSKKSLTAFEMQDYLFSDHKQKNFMTCLTESVQTLPSEMGSPSRGVRPKQSSTRDQINMKFIKEVEDLESSSLSTLGKTLEDAPISSSPRIEPDELYLRSPTLKSKEDLALQAQKERNIIKQLLKVQNNPPPCPAPTKGTSSLNFISYYARYLLLATSSLSYRS